MKCAIYALAIIGFLTVTAWSQQPDQCPQGWVCISPDAARKALQDSDELKAVKAENVVLKKAIEGDPSAPANADGTPSPANLGHKGVNTELRVELAKTTGKLTGAEQSLVENHFTIQTLSANCKARNRIGLIVF